MPMFTIANGIQSSSCTRVDVSSGRVNKGPNFLTTHGNVRQCCGNDVDYNIHFVVSSKHPPTSSEPQRNVLPLTYIC